MRDHLPLLTWIALLPSILHGAEAPVRELSTDRPDQTESAHTVPKGWFQVESNLISYSRTYRMGEQAESTSWSDFLLKYGLTENTDLQIGWAPYLLRRDRDTDGVLAGENSGSGDVTLRVKTNLVGNDSGPYAMAILPWVKIPSATPGLGNGRWEYGLTVNQELDIGGGWELGSSLFLAMAVSDERLRYFEPAFTLAVGHDLTERLAFYVETYQGWLYEDGRYWQSSVDGGLTYRVTPDVQLDAGVNWFFNGQQVVNPFVGLSFRF